MTWQSGCGTHEGYLVGLVFDDSGVFSGHSRSSRSLSTGRMRELGAVRDNDEEIVLSYVKVACSCGWRSPLLRAPNGTEWHPSCVFAPDAFELECANLWYIHVHVTGRAQDGGSSIADLIRAQVK